MHQHISYRSTIFILGRHCSAFSSLPDSASTVPLPPTAESSDERMQTRFITETVHCTVRNDHSQLQTLSYHALLMATKTLFRNPSVAIHHPSSLSGASAAEVEEEGAISAALT